MPGIESNVIPRPDQFPNVTDANIRKLGSQLIERLVIALMMKVQSSPGRLEVTDICLGAIY